MTFYPLKPTSEQILAAQGRTIPDLIAPGLKVLLCGINPGLYSAAVQQHFARPGNRFWRALYDAGMTSRLLSPFEADELLRLGYGITDLVDRATAKANEIAPDELAGGVRHLGAQPLMIPRRGSCPQGDANLSPAPDGGGTGGQ